MGGSRWDSQSWSSHQNTTRAQSQGQIFNQSRLHDDLNPANIKVRESLDSPANPNSTPIIITCDVTGSMGMTAEVMIKEGAGLIFQEVYNRNPVPDPHIMFAATGDAYTDSAPLQLTQFEASMALVDQLAKIWIEGNGGGNGGESYPMVWLAAHHLVSADAIQKRGKKGWLFTIGDESPHEAILGEQIQRVFGGSIPAETVKAAEILQRIEPFWNVFHLIINPSRDQPVERRWRELLGERAILVGDYRKLPEVIVSTMQVIEGADVDAVANSWSGDTALVVRSAVRGLAKTTTADGGAVRL